MSLRYAAALFLAGLPVQAWAFEAGNYDDPTVPATLMVLTAQSGPDRLFENIRIAKPGCLGEWTVVLRYDLPKAYGGGPIDARTATGSGVIDCAGRTTRLTGIGPGTYASAFTLPAPNEIKQDMAMGWGGTFRMRSGALVGITGRASPFSDAQSGLTVRVMTNRPGAGGRVQTLTLREALAP